MFGIIGMFNKYSNSGKEKHKHVSGNTYIHDEPVGNVFTCTHKFRDLHGRIYGYRIKDNYYNETDYEAAVLKDYIRNGMLEVTNLKLTSDGRLIDASPIKEELKVDGISKADNFEWPDYDMVEINRAFVDALYKIIKDTSTNVKNAELTFVGVGKENVNSFLNKTEASGYKKYLFENKTVLLIGNNDKYIIASSAKMKLANTRVSGASTGVFEGLKLKKLVLKDIGSRSTEDMTNLFAFIDIDDLDIASIVTCSCKRMSHMFNGAKTRRLNLTNFEVEYVETFTNMFAHCETELICNNTKILNEWNNRQR